MGGGWKNTLPKPPVKRWFHVAGSWEQGGAACANLNGKKGLCETNTGTNNGHDGTGTAETLVIGGRGHDDIAHNPSVFVNDVRVYDPMTLELGRPMS